MNDFDRLQLLRELLATAQSNLLEVPPDKSAPLLKEARTLAAEIDSLTGASQVKPTASTVDELRARRESRRRRGA